MTCRLLVSQKAFPQRDVLSCAEDRTGQEAPPVDSCALILLEPRLLRPKYMQRGDSGRLSDVHPRDKRALSSRACEKETDLEFPAQQIFVGYLLLTACDGYGRREGVYVA